MSATLLVRRVRDRRNRPKGPTLNRIARTTLALLGATLVVVVAHVRPARAQNLSDATLTDTAMSPDDLDQIQKFLTEHGPGLTSADPKAINDAKGAICAPLANTSISLAFRTEYGKQVLSIVSPLIADKRELVAINALRIAGALGTPAALELSLKGLDDQRPSVRLMGAMSVGLSISTARVDKSRAIFPSNVGDALKQIDKKMQEEKDPRVLDAMVLALSDAMRVKSAEIEGVREKAMLVMLSNVGRIARDKSFPPTIDLALAHAVKALGEVLISDGASKPADENIKEAAGVAGDVVAVILRRLDGGLSDASRGSLSLLAGESEGVVQRAEKLLLGSGGTPPSHHLDELLRDGKDAEFREAAKGIFGDLTGQTLDRKQPPNRYPN